jgi:hypothetical protein
MNITAEQQREIISLNNKEINIENKDVNDVPKIELNEMCQSSVNVNLSIPKEKENDVNKQHKKPLEEKSESQNSFKCNRKNENESLEDEERKKRWITDGTKDFIIDANSNHQVTNKEELLSKLSQLENQKISASTKISEKSQIDLQKVNSPENLDSVFITSHLSSPDSKLHQTQKEKKFTNVIENLHEGKPAYHSKYSKKDELLNKLFGNTNNDYSLTSKQHDFPLNEQLKFYNIDQDYEKSIKNEEKFDLSHKRLIQKKETIEKKKNISSTMKNMDFINDNVGFHKADLNVSSNYLINRPKVDKFLLSYNNNANNFVDDVEEFTL